jgi:membrane-bound ClpP family serine protease
MFGNSGKDGMQVGKSKIGRFLLFIGLILLVVFFAMDQAKNPSYGYFCVGVIVVIVGGMLMLRGQPPPAESMRFRTVRRWREQQRQRKEERKEADKNKLW